VPEGELAGGHLVGREPAELADVVGRRQRSVADPGAVVDVERGDNAPFVLVAIHPDAEQALVREPDPCLLAQLAGEAVKWALSFLEESTGKIPLARARIVRSLAEQDATFVVADHRGCRGHRVREGDEATYGAFDAAVLGLDRARADGTVLPTVELAHASKNTAVPRHVPASVTELSRVGLLAALPGELLMKLAGRMQREEIGPGAPIVTEGEDGERFYVVLSGLLSVTQTERGFRGVLKPGDYFGEVALAMDMPRTASVSPMTPVTLASCDRETFDEFIRPLFSD
jgi:Cyclic nucleotide-binding domain